MILGAFLLVLLLVSIRLILGPTAPDRVVALDAAGTVLIFILALVSYLYNEWYLVDIALVYAFLSFVAVIVISRYIRGDWQ